MGDRHPESLPESHPGLHLGRHQERQPERRDGREPHELPIAAPRRRIARGRLAAVSVRAAMAAGAWVGFALGLVLGALGGVVLTWFAGAVLDWQRELGLSLGIARNLLPFGDQIGTLRSLAQSWWAVIPVAAVSGGLLAAVFAALVGGLIAAAYNRTPRHATVLVELPEHERTEERPARHSEPRLSRWETGEGRDDRTAGRERDQEAKEDEARPSPTG